VTRRDLLRNGAFAPAAWLPQTPRLRTSRPNILLLMADQWRADCLGAAGNRAIHTPNLDQLAAGGVRFTNAYSSTPTCTPARAALLTGLAPWNHGMLRYANVATRYPIEMPRALRDAGYYTAVIGKLHYHPQRNVHGYHQALLDESGRIESPDFRSDYRSWFWSQAPNLDPDATGLGWNDFDAKPYALPERLHPTAWTGQTAAAWIESYQRAEPFFLKVSFARPHSPYDPPERFWRRYQDADLPAATVSPWAKRFAPRSGPQTDAWHGDLGVDQVRRSRQGYYGSVTFIDEQIAASSRRFRAVS
jgi:arylsulfatase A-like enzyme